MIKNFAIFIAIFCIFNVGIANAETYSLFEKDPKGNSVPVTNYETIIQNLKPNDELQFTNGTTIKIGNVLGHGNTSLIFEIANDETKVLRIPINSETQNFIKSTHFGYLKLLESGVPIVTIHNPASNEYVVTDRLGKNIRTFEEMAVNYVSPVEKKEMVEALKDFARKTAVFSHIGDFKHIQMAYDVDKKSWILFDWTNSHFDINDSAFKGRSLPIKSIFDDYFFSQFLSHNISGEKVAKRPEYQWLVKLAEELNNEVANERIRIKPPVIKENPCRILYDYFL